VGKVARKLNEMNDIRMLSFLAAGFGRGQFAAARRLRSALSSSIHHHHNVNVTRSVTSSLFAFGRQARCRWRQGLFELFWFTAGSIDLIFLHQSPFLFHFPATYVVRIFLFLLYSVSQRFGTRGRAGRRGRVGRCRPWKDSKRRNGADGTSDAFNFKLSSARRGRMSSHSATLWPCFV